MIKTLTHQYENWTHAHWEDFLYILSMNTVLLRKEAMHQTSLVHTASLQWPILFFAYGNLGFERGLIHCLFPQKGSIPVQNQPLSVPLFSDMFRTYNNVFQLFSGLWLHTNQALFPSDVANEACQLMFNIRWTSKGCLKSTLTSLYGGLVHAFNMNSAVFAKLRGKYQPFG